MKMHELLAQPTAWTKGACARNAEGFAVPHDDPSAVCWCLVGAAAHCYGMKNMGRFLDEIGRRIGISDFTPEADWNDQPERTHAEVLEVLKNADF